MFARPAQDRRPQPVIKVPKIETLFVAVSGVGTLEPRQWRDDTGEAWLASIPATIAPGAAVFHFPHDLHVSDNDVWQNLIESAPDFVNDLGYLIEHEKIGHVPIVLVAHSLGGIVVKEALRIIHEEIGAYRQLLRSLAGVILLGTPHSALHDSWKNATNILYAGRGNPRKRPLTAEEISRLCESSMRFESAAISIPIISAYETQRTKIRKNGFFAQKVTLVEESLVVTNIRNEETVSLDTDHRNLCNVDVGDEAFAHICAFLQSALEEARNRIVTESPEYHPPTAIDAWSTDDGLDAYGIDFDPTDLRGIINEKLNITGIASRSDPRSMWVTTGESKGVAELPNSKVDSPAASVHIEWPVCMIPYARNKDFFGRQKDIKSIERAFFDSGASIAESAGSGETPRTFAVCGPGGMGKTQLAAEFVHIFKDRFDAIFWIRADKAAKMADSFRNVAIRLGLIDEESTEAQNPVIVRDLVKGWLANPLKSSTPQDDQPPELATWLLVFDNVDEPDVMEDYWPLNGSGNVLFTSRDPYTKDSPYLARRGIDLEPFSLNEASDFLSKMTKKEGETTKIAKMLGGFPLALGQIAAVIIRRKLSLAEFILEYEEGESHLEMFELKVPNQARNAAYDHNLASVWALEKLRDGAVLLRVISFFDPDGIAERILNAHPHNVPLEDYPRSATRYFRAREELLQSSLIVKDQYDRIVIHRLIQDMARAKMSQEDCRAAFTTAATLISSVWPSKAFGWRHEIDNWKSCEELFPHIWRLKELSRHLQPGLGTSPEDFVYVKLINDAGWYYHESGNSFEAASLFEAAQVVAENLRSVKVESNLHFTREVNSVLAEIHHNLGCVATETNDPTGTLEHFQAFKDIVSSREVNEADATDLKVSIAWNELGNAWMLNNDWAQGEHCFKQSIATAKASPRYEPTEISFPMVNLGLAYWFTARLEDAAAVLQEGLQHREAAFGKDDKKSFITGRFLHALGNVRTSQGLLDEAFELHRRGLGQYLSTLGKRHHRTGDLYVKVAEHHARRGDLSEARRCLDEAIRIFRSRSVLRQELCRASVKQSLVLDRIGDRVSAGIVMDEALQVYRELRPKASVASAALAEADVDGMVAFWSR